MSYARRKHGRVTFDPAISAQMVAVDGSWTRDCQMADIATHGAGLIVPDGVKELDLNEFYLVLTPAGQVRRKCRLVWIDDNYLGVQFVRRDRVTAATVLLDLRQRALAGRSPT